MTTEICNPYCPFIACPERQCPYQPTTREGEEADQ